MEQVEFNFPFIIRAGADFTCVRTEICFYTYANKIRDNVWGPCVDVKS